MSSQEATTRRTARKTKKPEFLTYGPDSKKDGKSNATKISDDEESDNTDNEEDFLTKAIKITSKRKRKSEQFFSQSSSNKSSKGDSPLFGIKIFICSSYWE